MKTISSQTESDRFHDLPLVGMGAVAGGAPKYENNYTLDGKWPFLNKFHDHMLNRFDCYLDGIHFTINSLWDWVQLGLVGPDMKTISE